MIGYGTPDYLVDKQGILVAQEFTLCGLGCARQTQNLPCLFSLLLLMSTDPTIVTINAFSNTPTLIPQPRVQVVSDVLPKSGCAQEELPGEGQPPVATKAVSGLVDTGTTGATLDHILLFSYEKGGGGG
jgi:hypothetical protein